MSWERRRVARVEYAEHFGGLHVTGWDHVRHCGCTISTGMRLDKNEATASVSHCQEHEAYVARAFDTMQHMPPQDEAIMDLFARLLDGEIELAEGRS